MKTNHLIYIMAFIANMMAACSSQPVPKPEKPKNLIMGMTIVQFSSPHYMEYVVAEERPLWPSDEIWKDNDLPVPDSVINRYIIRSIGGTCQEFFLGTSPYIELTDNFYLVDWKWGNFIYSPTNVLLDVKWKDVNNRLELWDLRTDLISDKADKFLKVWAITSRKKIDIHLRITPTPVDSTLPDYGSRKNISPDYLIPWFAWEFNTISQLQNQHKKYKKDSLINRYFEDYCREVERQDSLQTVYVERLKQIIQTGELEKITSSFYTF